MDIYDRDKYPMIKELEYWYGRQIPRFLEQVVRGFSGFQYMTGWRNGEPPQLKMVPCRVETKDRVVGHILRNNSENTILATPMITVQHTALTFDRDRVQNPTHVSTVNVVERAVDENGKYTGEQGNRYTVERPMGRPFTLTFQVDIWTSNMDQKYQIMEQILPVVCPTFEIQNSDNPIDQTAKTHAVFEDMTWTSRTMPLSGDNEIEIATITFSVPMWLVPPALVTQVRRIETIVANTNHGDDPISTTVVTYGNHRLRVESDHLTLLTSAGLEHDDEGNLLDWKKVFSQYGNLRPTESQVRLSKNLVLGDEEEIIGRLQYDANNPNKMFWSIDADTLPSNTMAPVHRLIDPTVSAPGGSLPPVELGQRYMLVSDISPSIAWGNLSASEGDIIEYTVNGWSVMFDASTAINDRQYVVNLHTGKQLKWTGETWILSIDGEYAAGYWRIVI